jgi:large subunit ribosomal protein L35
LPIRRLVRIGARFPASWKTEWPGQCGLPWRFEIVSRTREQNKETKMPKLKTKSGVKKRFKLTATGKIKHGVAGKRHRLISHNAKYIRQNRGTEILADADTARVKAWAPYGLK